MANQVVGEGFGFCYGWSFYVRGYHEYKEGWTPSLGEMLELKMERTNPHDRFATAVLNQMEWSSVTFPSMPVKLFYSFSRRLGVLDCVI